MDDAPVTVVVTRRVKAGREADYEAWLHELVQASTSLPGYLGTSIQRPPPTGPREYTSVFRFDTVANLRAFEQSDRRRRAMAQVVEFVEADATWRELSGLEVWFSAPAGTVIPQPSRERMAVVIIGVVYLLVVGLGAIVPRLVPQLPVRARQFLIVCLQVLLMTYVIMPRLTRALARWIYPVRASRS
jgi:uncharacterized protein